MPVEKPLITSYANHAFYLSALSSSKDYLGWFYSNYIQLKCTPYKKGLIWFDFYTLDPAYHYNPHLTTTSQIIQRDMLNVFKIGILDFIRESIDAGYYVHLNIDESVIPQSPKYNKGPFFHPIFIYGYNNTDRKFMTSGFFDNNKYQFIETDYDQIKAGYEGAIAEPHSLWINRLQLYKLNPTADYKFNIECIIDGLKEYYLSIPSDIKISHFEKPDSSASFGIKTYESMENYIDTVVMENNRIDIRPFHVIWEHKKVMVSRLKYMTNLEVSLHPSLQQYEELERETLTNRNTALKYSITNDARLLIQIKNNINSIQQKEKNVLEEMLSVLEKSKQKFK